MDIINEEETQFLKTLSRGKLLFERTVQRLESDVIPGGWTGFRVLSRIFWLGGRLLGGLPVIHLCQLLLTIWFLSASSPFHNGPFSSGVKNEH